MFEGLDRARRQDGSRELQLVWAGRLTEREGLTLSQLARDHGVEQAVDFRGYVSDEDLAELYREAVASVFVSRAEGFGYPVVEAMASGCPVITSNRSSMLEIAGDSAWLVDPEDPDAIAEAMATLTRDSSERKRLVALGLLRCQRFSVERMSRETLSVYQNVMRSDGSRGA
jgi:glycosyltransferase involved in cell wall biosynthesis